MFWQIRMRSLSTPRSCTQPDLVKVEPHANPRNDRKSNQEICIPFVRLMYTEASILKGVRAFLAASADLESGRQNPNLGPTRSLILDFEFIAFAPCRRLKTPAPHNSVAVIRFSPELRKTKAHMVTLLRDGQSPLSKIAIHRREKRLAERASQIRLL